MSDCNRRPYIRTIPFLHCTRVFIPLPQVKILCWNHVNTSQWPLDNSDSAWGTDICFFAIQYFLVRIISLDLHGSGRILHVKELRILHSLQQRLLKLPSKKEEMDGTRGKHEKQKNFIHTFGGKSWCKKHLENGSLQNRMGDCGISPPGSGQNKPCALVNTSWTLYSYTMHRNS